MISRLVKDFVKTAFLFKSHNEYDKTSMVWMEPNWLFSLLKENNLGGFLCTDQSSAWAMQTICSGCLKEEWQLLFISQCRDTRNKEILLVAKGIWSRTLLFRNLPKDWGSLEWKNGEIFHAGAVPLHKGIKLVVSVRRSTRMVASHPVQHPGRSRKDWVYPASGQHVRRGLCYLWKCSDQWTGGNWGLSSNRGHLFFFFFPLSQNHSANSKQIV